MSSISSYDSSDPPSSHETNGTMSLGLNDVKVKLEPVESVSESRLESLAPVSPLLSLGVHHRMRVYSRSTQSTSPETFACEVCQGEFLFQEVLQAHKLLHFNTRHVCYACDSYFLKAETLIAHMTTIHGSMSVLSQNHKGEIFVCSICLQRFSSKKILQKHESQHASRDEANNSCKICALDFPSYRPLLAHLNSSRHREMKVKMQNIFVCVDCRSIFASRDSYAMHMMVRAQNESCDSSSASLPTLPGGENLIKSETKSPEQPEVNGTLSSNEEMNSAPLNLSKETKVTEALNRGISSVLASISHRHQHHCGKCQKSFASLDALAMHVMLHAKTEAEDEHQQSIQSKLGAVLLDRQAAILQAALPFTSLSLPSSSPLSLVSRHAVSVWPCQICHVTFPSCDLLAMHVMERHAAPNSLKNGGGKVSDDRMTPTRKEFKNRGDVASKGTAHSLTSVLEELQKAKKEMQKKNQQPSVSLPENKVNPLKRRHSLPQLATIADEELKASPEKRCRSADHTDCAIGSPWWRIMKLRFDAGSALECLLCQKIFLNQEDLESHQRSEEHMLKMLEIVSGSQEEKNSVKEVLSEEQQSCQSPIDPGTEHMSEEDKSSLPRVEEPTQSSPVVSRKHRRKLRNASRVVQGLCHSPEPSEMSPWMDEGSSGHLMTDMLSPISGGNDPTGEVPRHSDISARSTPVLNSPARCPSNTSSGHASRQGINNLVSSSKPSFGIPDGVRDADLLEYILGHVDNLVMCRFCGIIFTDRTMYYLHMGLHNVNNPWQCNLCGKVCSGVHQFSSHVIHY